MTREQIIREIFYFLAVLSGVFILLEIIFPNIILVYFNLNWLFLLWLACALFILIKK